MHVNYGFKTHKAKPDRNKARNSHTESQWEIFTNFHPYIQPRHAAAVAQWKQIGHRLFLYTE